MDRLNKKSLDTEILVIGGGATGTGVARDLAMRGFKTILVEKADLTHGTTGRYHGLLHSGGRYVVKDPQAAKECIEENRILRKIMPQCIEDTGGYFVVTPWDDPNYATLFVEGCKSAGIPVEELSIAQMLRSEPLLNPEITRCFRVPDASADSFLGADLNADSAQAYGAQILTYHKVVRLLTEGSQSSGHEMKNVVGAVCHDLVKDQEIVIHADMVVNASGAWAGKIAETAGIPLTIIGGKGTMIAVNHRIVQTVINRCKMPSDGDILVPAHTVCVIGTTDVKISDPDHFAIEPWEVHLCLEEGDKLVPGFKNMRMLRAWAGVRPLYQESQVSDTREVTRAFVLLDHELRDGVTGIITITSGKWTTYRKMAEVTADLVCKKLGTQRACRTHLEMLPGPDHKKHYLGARLAQIEQDKSYGQLVCECELATYADVTRSILERNAKTIDDVRRDVRLGMGPCQGGFCTYRVAGILHRLAPSQVDSSKPSVELTNVALRDFLQERWKGLLPVLWGQQLRQERLDELIYLDVLNADHLPGPVSSRLGPEMYAQPSKLEGNSAAADMFLPEQSQTPTSRTPAPITKREGVRKRSLLDILVIGGGLAGLFSAWKVAQKGKKVRLVTKGWGALHWGSGCINVLGYYPLDSTDPLQSPVAGIKQILRENSKHPYALVQLEHIEAALEDFKTLSAQLGYPFHGDLDRNWLLPSALGTFRPACLVPETMVAGDLRQNQPMLIVGFEQYPDFYSELIAANLTRQGRQALGVTIDLPSLRQQRFVSGRVLASLFESAEFRREVAWQLKTHLQGAKRVGFPAVLGLKDTLKVKNELETLLEMPVFEIPTLPPSIPGIRLHNLLIAEIERLGGQVYDGMQAQSAAYDGSRISTVYTEAAARLKPHHANTFILATGGILGGGIHFEYGQKPSESVFNLPVMAPDDHNNWFESQFLATTSHPIYQSGILVSDEFKPVQADGSPLFENLYIAGNQIGSCDSIRERSAEGIALATAYSISNQLS